jgi:glucosamine--fructose-6-phosphate aminotransferase (isomerizing)
VLPGTLLVTVSQSGETADTLAALRHAKEQAGYIGFLAICNVPASSLVRESECVLMTRAGMEIGVASTKAFTSQLTAFLLLVLLCAHFNQGDTPELKKALDELKKLPALCEKTLKLNTKIQQMAKHFADKQHALFLGRGIEFPIALEGALKLKEISYIHAEAYPAGELKHGPLALVDKNMPVIVVAPNDGLLHKLKSNIEEVRARGGECFVFTDESTDFDEKEMHVIKLPPVDPIIAPIVYTIPLQLLAYHVAVLKGTDVDQPRNLAKSVTVE